MLTWPPSRSLAALLLMAAGCVLGISGCGKDSTTQSGSDAEQFLLDRNLLALDYAGGTTIVDLTDGSLALRYIGSDSLAIEAGTYIVGTVQRPIMRQVLTLTRTDRPGAFETVPDTILYEMETTEASLADLLLNGRILWQQLLTLQNAYNNDRTTFTESALPGISITSSGVEFANVTLADTIDAQRGTRLEVTVPSGRFQFAPRLDLFGRFVIDTGLADTYSLITGTLEWASTLRVVVTDSIDYAHEFDLFAPLAYASFRVDNDGNLPLQVDVSFGLSAALAIQSSGAVDAQLGLSERSDLELGGRHLRGRDWFDLWDTTTTVESYSLSYDVNEDLVVELTLRPYFITSIHGGAGAELSAELVTRFAGRATVDPWQWQLSRSLNGAWSFDPARLETGMAASFGRLEGGVEILAEDGAGSTNDITPPARIADLARTAVDSTSVTLEWTAPGDDGMDGFVAAYDVRYSTWDQVLLQWDQSHRVDGAPEPVSGGSPQTMTVEGLLPGTTYHFAVESIDEAGNRSAISNVVLARTLGQSLAAPPVVFVPAGSFRMGDGSAPCGVDQHDVTLTHDVYIGQYEITNIEYLEMLQWAYQAGLIHVDGTQVKDATGSGRLLLDMTTDDCEIAFDHGSGLFSIRQSSFALRHAYPEGYDPTAHPVKRVTWYGAVSYCNWLSLTRGYSPAYDPHTWDAVGGRTIYQTEGYRLPTDAEWEYVAQYNVDGTYPWGWSTPSCDLANIIVANQWCLRWTAATGSYPEGAQQEHLAPIYDLTGNLWEWCHDRWKCALGSGAVTDPTGPTTGGGRVLRGGSWSSTSDMYRSAARSDFTAPGYPSFLVGFRIARTVTP
jgi:formylglycine-generating enzyme required for sulfatase activity